jgi:hypothetical protein
MVLLLLSVEAGPYTPIDYEKLNSNSELIVIATPVKSTPSNEHIRNDMKIENIFSTITTFHVITVLKGKHTESSLQLLHFNYKNNPGNSGVNMSHFASFYSQGGISFPKDSVGLPKKPQTYLLFLNSGSKYFLPTLGQFDSENSCISVKNDPFYKPPKYK